MRSSCLPRNLLAVSHRRQRLQGVDRLGFHVRMKTRDGTRGARIAFLRAVNDPAETRKVLVEMVQQARSQAE